MQPIEIIVIIACVLIVGSVLLAAILRRIRNKKIDDCGSQCVNCPYCSSCSSNKLRKAKKKENKEKD